MYSFGTSGNPAPQPPTPATPAVGPQPDLMSMLMPILAKMFMQQPQGGGGAAPFDFASMFSALRHDPQGDANTGYTPGTKNAFNPFDNGFFKQSAASLTPEQLAASQGSTAMNQFKWPELFHGSMPSDQTNAEAAKGASKTVPNVFFPQGAMMPPTGGRQKPLKNKSRVAPPSLETDKKLYAPGGWQMFS